jgi:hypothetical protein
MKHPSESDLALYAGHDLNVLKEWRVSRHVSRCERCRETVDEFASLRSATVELGELPADINWNRLASEMKANIRLGLEAGECVAGHSGAGNRWGLPAFTGFHTLLAYGALMLLVVAGVWLQRPAPVDTGRAMVTATGDGIEFSADGRSLGFRYGTSRDPRDVNYSADAKGGMGARYVDSNAGSVTVVNVNVE